MVRLVEASLDNSFIDKAPEKQIDSKAYNSDKLYKNLIENRCVEMIDPHRKNRSKPRTQDGRKIRRYRRRWKVERFFAWLQNIGR